MADTHRDTCTATRTRRPGLLHDYNELLRRVRSRIDKIYAEPRRLRPCPKPGVRAIKPLSKR